MCAYEWCCDCRELVGVIESHGKKYCPICNSENITPVTWTEGDDPEPPEAA